MGLLERVREAHNARFRPQLAWPTGDAPRFEGATGHWPSYDPDAYGSYIASSTDVYSAATLRARAMSSLRLRLYSGRDFDKREITTGAQADLLRHVNPFWTWRRLVRMDELAMCLWGETFWAIERDERGPREIWWCKPTRMRPVPHPDRYLAGFLYLPENGGPAIPFAPDEVVWFRYPHPIDEFQSLSPLAAARLAADTGSAMMRANRELFSRGLLAGGMVVPDTDKIAFSREQAKELESLLEHRWTGVDRAHRWSVLRYQAKFQGLGVSPKDAEFVEGLNLTLRQVANAYGIPVPLLNDLSHATLANVRDLERWMWQNSLVADAELRGDEIEEQLLPMFGRRPGPPASADHVEFDFTRVPALQESASESWTREGAQIDRGALTINEWRRGKGLPDVPWGDVYWAPVNKAPVEDGDSVPAQVAQPAEPAAPLPGPADGDATGEGGGSPAEEEELPEAAGWEPGRLLGALDDFRRLAGRPLAATTTGRRNGHHR